MSGINDLQQAKDLPDQSNDHRLRVLLVDDSAMQRRILSVSLRKQGYEIIEADSGQTALELCKTMPPDIVLSDWMMPGMDGLEFCRRFRKMEKDGYGYFILLTSRTDKGDVSHGLDCGADDYLPKPVVFDELRARLSAGERIVQMHRELAEKNRQLSGALSKLQELYEAQEKELTDARQLQQSLVPERFRDFGQGQISLMLRPSGHVGGDLVGFFPSAQDEVLMYAIDVSGHGISSALMTARLAAYLSPGHPAMNLAMQEGPAGIFRASDPHAAVGRINERLLSDMQTDHYATMVLASLNLRTGQLRLCQAGHPHPIIHRASGRMEQLGQGGLPVGLFDGAEFETVETRLDPGDRLWILSDGISESTDRAGDFLGDARTSELVRMLGDMPTNTALDGLMWHLADHAGSEDFGDDISAILWNMQRL